MYFAGYSAGSDMLAGNGWARSAHQLGHEHHQSNLMKPPHEACGLDGGRLVVGYSLIGSAFDDLRASEAEEQIFLDRFLHIYHHTGSSYCMLESHLVPEPPLARKWYLVTCSRQRVSFSFAFNVLFLPTYISTLVLASIHRPRAYTPFVNLKNMCQSR